MEGQLLACEIDGLQYPSAKNLVSQCLGNLHKMVRFRPRVRSMGGVRKVGYYPKLTQSRRELCAAESRFAVLQREIGHKLLHLRCLAGRQCKRCSARQHQHLQARRRPAASQPHRTACHSRFAAPMICR